MSDPNHGRIRSCCNSQEQNYSYASAPGSLYTLPHHHVSQNMETIPPNMVTDASVALYRISKGHAKGSGFRLNLRHCHHRAFSSLEHFSHKHRLKIIVIGIVILGLMCLGLKTVSFEMNLEKLWMEDNGRLQAEMKYITKALGGEGRLGSMEAIIQVGGNLTTPKALLDHLNVLLQIRQVSVSMGGRKWKLDDICQKANLPYGGGHRMEKFIHQFSPCLIISPLDCFWEGSKAMGPDDGVILPMFAGNVRYKWSNFDPLKLLTKVKENMPYNVQINELLQRVRLAGIDHGYQKKPCLNPADKECPTYASKSVHSPPNIGKTLTGGCSGFATNILRYPQNLMVGGVKRSGPSGTIVEAKALQTILLIRSPKEFYNHFYSNSYYELSLKSIETLIEEWQWKLRAKLKSINGMTESSHQNGQPAKDSSKFYAFTNSALNDILSSFTIDPNPMKIVGTVILTISYAIICCIHWKESILSHCWLAIVSFILIVLSVVAGLGLSALIGLKFTVLSLQVLPFVMVGFGMNDVLTMICQHASLAKQNPCQEFAGKTLQLCAPVIFYTSLSCIAAFLTGTVISVPLMRIFCLQAAIINVLQILTVVLILPALFSFDLTRRLDLRMDVVCCLINFQGHSYIPATLHTPTSLQPVPGPHDTGDSSKTSGTSSSSSLSSLPVATGWKNGLDGAMSWEDAASAILPRSNSTESEDLLEARTTPTTPPAHPSLVTDPCHRRHSLVDGDKGPCDSFVSRISAKWVIEHYLSPALVLLPVKVLVILVSTALFFLSVFGITRLQFGLEFDWVVPQKSMEEAFIRASDENFGLYNFQLITKGDFDYPNNQRLLRSYHERFNQLPKIIGAQRQTADKKARNTTFRSDGVPSILSREVHDRPVFWLDALRDWLLEFQVAFDEDYKHGRINSSGEWTGNASTRGVMGLKLLLHTGGVNQQLDVDRVTKGRLVSNGIIYHKAFYVYLRAWRSLDPLGYMSLNFVMFPEHQTHTISVPSVPGRAGSSATINSILPTPPIEFVQTSLYMVNVSDNSEMIEVIKTVREITDYFQKLGLPNFPNGMPFTLCEHYLHLCGWLTTALLVAFACHFLFTFLTLGNLWTLISVLTSGLTLLQLVGVMGLLDYRLNASSAVLFIVWSGQALRFQNPIILSFVTSLISEDKDARMRSALVTWGPAVFHSSAAMLLSLFMLIFSPVKFIDIFFFRLIAVAVAITLFNSLVLLPILLSLIGSSHEVGPVVGYESRYLAPPTPTLTGPPHSRSSRRSGNQTTAPSTSTSTLFDPRLNGGGGCCGAGLPQQQHNTQRPQHQQPCQAQVHRSPSTDSSLGQWSRPVSLSTISEEPSHLSSNLSLNSGVSRAPPPPPPAPAASVFVTESEIVLHQHPHQAHHYLPVPSYTTRVSPNVYQRPPPASTPKHDPPPSYMYTDQQPPSHHYQTHHLINPVHDASTYHPGGGLPPPSTPPPPPPPQPGGSATATVTATTKFKVEVFTHHPHHPPGGSGAHYSRRDHPPQEHPPPPRRFHQSSRSSRRHQYPPNFQAEEHPR